MVIKLASFPETIRVRFNHFLQIKWERIILNVKQPERVLRHMHNGPYLNVKSHYILKCPSIPILITLK